MPPERKVALRARPKLAGGGGVHRRDPRGGSKAPRKQRHTAHRIWCRCAPRCAAVTVAESTVREYVRERKVALGLLRAEIFVPQSYRSGQEGQVDWYEAWAEIDGERQKVYIFCMRSMASGAGFHRAYPHASQQAFLEAHELAFALLWWRLRGAALRQSGQRGEEDLARPQREETRTFHRLSLALGRSKRSSARPAKGTRKAASRARRLLSPQPSGPGAARSVSGGAQRLVIARRARR